MDRYGSDVMCVAQWFAGKTGNAISATVPGSVSPGIHWQAPTTVGTKPKQNKINEVSLILIILLLTVPADFSSRAEILGNCHIAVGESVLLLALNIAVGESVLLLALNT